jgi:pantetheine-phosphate adenylyltransferase
MKAIFPGSFDPFTKGHEAVVNRALMYFDEIIIAIGENSKKQAQFEMNVRKKHIHSLFNSSKISIINFSGLTIDLCRSHNADVILRGLRDGKDFEYEKSIAHMNYKMSGIDTFFLLTNEELSSINSSIVREIHKNGGNIAPFVTNAEILV